VRILFLGDIVGAPGVAAVKKLLPGIRTAERLDLVVANAENATNGSGLSPKDYRQLRTGGLDAITLGDHIYKKQEIAEVMASPREPICKPANFPADAPGRDRIHLTVNGLSVVVISLLGRTFMRPVDCPFAAVDRVLKSLPDGPRIVLVDIHAEATADKYLMAHHLKGRVTAVLGTHTHVPTADEQFSMAPPSSATWACAALTTAFWGAASTACSVRRSASFRAVSTWQRGMCACPGRSSMWTRWVLRWESGGCSGGMM